ncbi:MAG: NVEALA domain-containing protein [Prevotella sp.]|jgi:hypothetical protein|nr:NVEALA domain-containing protein [Prevotella sp.]
MKRIYLSMIIIAAIASAAAWNFNRNQNEAGLSDLTLANVEALASGEGGTTATTCLGLWGSCSTPSGATSKAPLVEISF